MEAWTVSLSFEVRHKHVEKPLWQGCAMSVGRPLWAEAGRNNVIHPVTAQNVSPGAERAEPLGLNPTALVGTGSAWEKAPGAGSSHGHRAFTLGPRAVLPCRGAAASREGRELAGARREPRAAGTHRLHCRTRQLDGSRHDPPGIRYRKGTPLCNYNEIILGTLFWLPVGPTHKYSL